MATRNTETTFSVGKEMLSSEPWMHNVTATLVLSSSVSPLNRP